MTTPPGWPKGVEPMSVEALERLGIDGNNELFWDGQRLVTRNKLLLTGPQTVLAVLAAVATVIGGVNNAANFLCARNLHWLTCPAAQTATPLTKS